MPAWHSTGRKQSPEQTAVQVLDSVTRRRSSVVLSRPIGVFMRLQAWAPGLANAMIKRIRAHAVEAWTVGSS